MIMKKIKFYAIAALAATVLAGCSSDNDILPETGKDAITFSVGVNNMTSRAGYSSSELPDLVRLRITGKDTSYSNIYLRKQDDGSYKDNNYLLTQKSDDRNVTATAFTSKFDNQRFSVQTDQSSEENLKKSDLLGARSTDGDITIDGNNISISLGHWLTKLEVIFKFTNQYSQDNLPTISSATLKGAFTKVEIMGSSLKLGEKTEVADINMLVQESPNKQAEAIFIPTSDNLSLQFQTLQGETSKTYVCDIATPEGGFQQGAKYTMTVIIGASQIESNNIKASIENGWSSPVEGGGLNTK